MVTTDTGHADISLVIATYNSGPFLKDSLLENLQHSFQEIIIVDGESTDQSSAVIQSLQITFPEKIKFFQIPKKGLANARNFGSKQAAAKYVMHAGPDNIIPEKTVQIMLNDLKQYDLVSCQTRLLHADNYLNRAHNCYKKRFSPGAKDVVGTPYLAENNLFKSYPFDESMLNSDDTELCYRLQLTGKKIYRSKAICWEIGFDTISSVFERWSRWGRGDGLFYRKMYTGWSIRRRFISLLRPFIAEIVESWNILTYKEFLRYLPFLLLVCSYRYYGWLRFACVNR